MTMARHRAGGAGAAAPGQVLKRYRLARDRRAAWEAHWRECYAYVLPNRERFGHEPVPGEKRSARVFDATAGDAVDQLAASLLAQLTPPWSRWFGFAPGTEVAERDRAELSRALDDAAAVLQSHFDRSNFAVEIHQCYLDLVTGGTACLLLEEGAAGAPSAFRFTAVPLFEAVLDEGPDGRLDTTFRRAELTREQLRARFPGVALPEDLERRAADDPTIRFGVVEAVLPERQGYRYLAMLDAGTRDDGDPVLMAEGRFDLSPFINFRWLKAPGEIYGRSPVMKALPDIKTANKVVELVLKNASIAVTGIWQADDDGVLNPANIKLVPGAIIPKAVGSAGLTPLDAPGRFDISQLVLDDLRARIRHALLVDRLGQVAGPRMTATEVLERAAEMTRTLGATFGRLQSELLDPLLARAVAILRRRGEIPDLEIDGRRVKMQCRSPLARIQAQAEVQSVMTWLESAAAFGPAAVETIDVARATVWMAKALGVPAELVRSDPPAEARPTATGDEAATLAAAVANAGGVGV